MRRALSESDLNRMATGSKVEDSDGDIWQKSMDGTWTLPGAGGSFSRWSAYRLTDDYKVYYLEGEEPEGTMPVVASDVLEPARTEAVSDERLRLRLEVLRAQSAWLDEGMEDDVFAKGLANGWFTDKFFKDLAEGDAF